MAIESEPFVSPAKEEEVFGYSWIKEISINAPDGVSGEIRMRLYPYNPETQKISDEKEEFISVPLWEAVENIPEVAQAMGVIFAAIPAIKAYLNENT